MPWVLLRYSDGEYSAQNLMDNEVEKLRRMGLKLALIGDGTWVAWMNHMREHEAWQEFWLMHDNAHAEERMRAERVWVVFRASGMGEVRRGPFEKHEYGEAVKARNEARTRYDSQAYYINDLGERKDSL